jgi:hypothetical protein
MTAGFPLPFHSRRMLRGGTDGPYLIASMFTTGYRAAAERLAASCDSLGLEYEIHEVSAVHNSISVRGSDDASHTKPNFIRTLLGKHRRPILYLDADCEILSPPLLLGELVSTGRDFAIYNWGADAHNERFFPVRLGEDEQAAGRYYRYVGCFEFESDTQLVCSGLAQFYGNSLAARLLLKHWHRTILSQPGCADDKALDFTFNNLARLSPVRLLLKPQWLPKSYARIAWWIHDQPVINHRDFPSPVGTFKPISHPTRKRFYTSRMRRRRKDEHFPLDCIIDTREGRICKLVDGKPVAETKTDARFWL